MNKRNKWIVVGVIALVLLALGAAAGLYYRDQTKTRTVRGSSSVEFVTTQAPGKKKRSRRVVRKTPWPQYGYDEARTHVAADFHHRPPFRRVWTVETGWLVEFPPAIGDGLVFVGNLKGRFLAIDAESGKVAWRKEFGRCIASGPAVKGRIVVVAVTNPYPCLGRDSRTSKRGFVVAMDALTGRQLWRHHMGVTESSPLIVRDLVYVGSWDHHVYALDLASGKIRWTQDTGEEIDSSAAYADGIVYIGGNDGHVFAFNAWNGRLIWRASSFSRFGQREYFYATPAVAYGRVYIGNTDGTLYAFGARTGDLLWAQHAGTYVYTAATVWRRRVYVGTYDGYFKAYNAATGDEIWSWSAPAKVHAASTLMAGLVYFSTASTFPGAHPSRYIKRGPRGIYALNARTGKLVWQHIGIGMYSPLVADEDRTYLIGSTRVYAVKSRNEREQNVKQAKKAAQKLKKHKRPS